MEKVSFINAGKITEAVEKTYVKHKNIIRHSLPDADIQHVGSTAIPNSMTKGDLDIQVRVKPHHFPKAIEELSILYDLNEGSVKTREFRAFKNESENPPLGIQLTVIGSEFDFFWKLREVLIMNDKYRAEYDALKRNYEGKEMEEYREAKDEFFDKIMITPEYKRLK